MNFFNAVKKLDYRQVSYGFFDDPHYSGLNTATLAAIHQEGWNNLPARTFMTSAGVFSRKNLKNFRSTSSVNWRRERKTRLQS